MKNLITLMLLLLGSIRNQTIGQTYLNTTARWTQSYTWNGFTASSHCTTKYYVEGDSLIHDTTYYQIFSDVLCFYTQTEYDSLGNSYQVTDTNASNTFAMLLREEDGKFIRRFGQQEDMLYNFNVNDFTGITLAVQNPVCGTTNPSLMTHDMVCLGNISRKRWLISPSQYPLANYFIEGVGPSSGLSAPICRNGCPECSYSLIYFELNGDTLYHGNCLLLETEPKHGDTVSHSQTGELLAFHSNTLNRIEVYTLHGALVGAFNASNGQVSISLAQLQPGIYLYNAWHAGKPSHGKFNVLH